MKILNEREKYLKNERRKKIIVILCRIAIVVVFVALWELAANTGLIDSFFFSSPSRIVKIITDLSRQNLFYHIFVTLKECVKAFVISTAIGFLVAVALWWSDALRKILDPYVVILNALPKIALGPLIIIWVGSGERAIVTMGVLICVVVTVINVLTGFLATENEKIFLLRSLGASKFQILTKLVLPSSTADFVSALKVNIGLAWVGTIMGEYLVSGAGLGYLIIYGGAVFNLDLVMASTVLLCLLAGGMYFAVSLIEKIVVKK